MTDQKNDSISFAKVSKNQPYNIYSPFNGFFNVSGKENIIKFFTSINKPYIAGKTENYAEKQGPVSGLFLDFDFYQKTQDIQLTTGDIEILCDGISETINKFVNIGEYADYRIAVLRRRFTKNEKNELSLNYSQKHKLYKDGLHILVPEVQLTKENKQFLYSQITATINNKQLFNHRIFVNTDYLDIPSAWVPTFLTGSSKNGKSAYELLFIIKYDNESAKSYEPEIKRANAKFLMPLELSVNKWGCEKYFNEKQEYHLNEAGLALAAKLRDEKKEAEDAEAAKCDKYKPSDNEINLVMDDSKEFLNILSEIVESLPEIYAIETSKWHCVLSILKNIGITYNIDADIILKLANDFSIRGGDAYIGSIEALSDKLEFVKPKNYLGLLLYFVGTENPKKAALLRYRLNIAYPVEEYSTYSDYIKLVNKTTTIDEVKKWVNAALSWIDNGGKSFIATKNIKFDPVSKDNRTNWEFVPIKILLASLDANCYVLNPDFNEEKGETQRNKKHKFTNLKDIVKFILEKRDIHTFRHVDFYPYFLDSPNLRGCLNIFEPYEMINYKQKEEFKYCGSNFQKHISKYLCGDEEPVFEYLEKWIANLIQNPAEVCPSAILITSEQGTGKDLLRVFIEHMIGKQYSKKFSKASDFFKNFNSEQSGKLLITLNEVSEKGDAFKNHDQFKDLITSETLRIEPKGLDSYEIRRTAHYICFSNNDNCLYIENSDRRFCMIKADSSIANNYEYFKPLWELVNNRDFIKAAFDYYSTLDLTDWTPIKIPNTKYKNEQKIANLPVALKFIVDLVEDSEIAGHNYIVDNVLSIKSTNLYDCYKVYCSDNNHRSLPQRTFKEQIARIGLIDKRAQTDDGKFKIYNLSISELERLFQVYLKDKKFKFA